MTEILDNGAFRVNHYNTGTVVDAPGEFVVNRWKATGTFTAGHVTFTPPGAALTSVEIKQKPYRERQVIDIAVSASFDPATETVQLRQQIEDGQRLPPGAYRLRGAILGDYGATADAMVGDVLTGEKKSWQAAGLETVEPVDLEFTVPELGHPELTVDIFSNPTPGANYRLILFSLLHRPGVGLELPVMRPRPLIEELGRCAYYAVPVGRGRVGNVASTTSVVLAIPLHTRTTPTPLLVASSVDYLSRASATLFTSAAPAMTTPAISNRGAKVVITGFTSPSNPGSGTDGQITTDLAGVLDADY